MMIYRILWACALLLVVCGQVDAGLFFGPNVRVRTTNHYYGVAPPAVAIQSQPNVTYYQPAPMITYYQSQPTVTYYQSQIPNISIGVGVTTVGHPRKVAKHTAKAAKHQALANYYENN